MARRGLRLPLPRRPDPVLDEEELQLVSDLLEQHVEWATRKMERERVSESIIRRRLYGESALAKVRRALDG